MGLQVLCSCKWCFAQTFMMFNNPSGFYNGNMIVFTVLLLCDVSIFAKPIGD